MEHLSSSGGRLFWDNTYDDDHASGLFKTAINDPTERSYGAMTGWVKYGGKIRLTNAGGVSQVRVNSNLSRGFDTSCKKNSKRVERIFHKLSEEIRVSLVNMFIEDAPSVHAAERLALSKEWTAKRRK